MGYAVSSFVVAGSRRAQKNSSRYEGVLHVLVLTGVVEKAPGHCGITDDPQARVTTPGTVKGHTILDKEAAGRGRDCDE
jgi:hypothetical protein